MKNCRNRRFPRERLSELRPLRLILFAVIAAMIACYAMMAFNLTALFATPRLCVFICDGGFHSVLDPGVRQFLAANGVFGINGDYVPDQWFPMPGSDSTYLVIPYWLILAVAAFGLFFVQRRIVAQRRNGPGCRACGYNLTCNQSGICPECGTARMREANPDDIAGRTDACRSLTRS